mgnify:CR=1 FL=1
MSVEMKVELLEELLVEWWVAMKEQKLDLNLVAGKVVPKVETLVDSKVVWLVDRWVV